MSTLKTGETPRVQTALSRMEHIPAAVRQGADEVLLCPPAAGPPGEARLGGGDALRDWQAKAVDMLRYCRIRGVKTVLDLSFPHTDRELPFSAGLLRALYKCGLDAARVSDLGVLRMARMEAPELALHWGAVGGPDGLAMARALGCARAVLSPFLNRDAVSALAARKAGLELQIPLWETGCIASPLAPCYLSGSAANGTACAERFPGRKPPCHSFHYIGDTEKPLAKDNFDFLPLAAELADDGVDVFGVWFTFRSPEEAGAATGTARRALTGLEEPASLAEEAQRVPIHLAFQMMPRRPARMAADDGEGHVVQVTGPEPERVRGQGSPADEAACNTRLYQCGGTPYLCVEARSRVGKDCALPPDAFARMKEALLQKLGKERAKFPERKSGRFQAGVRYLPRREEPKITVELRRLEQLSRELLALQPACLYLPLLELADAEDDPGIIQAALEAGSRVAAVLPRFDSGAETAEALARCAGMGVKEALARRPEQLVLLRRKGLAARADFAAHNSQALKELKHMGVLSATLAMDLSLRAVREMSHVMDTELVAYGRMPLLLSEACLIRRSGLCGCEGRAELTDTDGVPYPLVREGGHASLLLDEAKLWLTGEKPQWQRAGLWAAQIGRAHV